MSTPVLGQSDHSPRDRARTVGPAVPVEVRHLRTRAERVACVELQHATWGADFSERVPAAILEVAQRVGGIAAGAFDQNDRVVGFVFGITGWHHGQPVHWSDMLAVRADLRDHGIGRRLKEFQREALLRMGVTRMHWTFDPLVARNAHFNLSRLGARVTEYVLDMYGSNTGSALHHGVGTDRFIVTWEIGGAGRPTRDDGGARTLRLPPSLRLAPILNPADATGAPAFHDPADASAGPILRVAIPLAIDQVQAVSVPAVALWRSTTRHAITWALQHGYGISGFYRDDAEGYGYYLLAATHAPPVSPCSG